MSYSYKYIRGYTQEWFTKLNLIRTLHKVERRNPILIHQMGKVGSSTVARTLKSLNIPHPILHIHTLNETNLRAAIRKQRESQSPFLPEHLLTSSLLIKKLSNREFPCRIVTLTREPIGRAISFVFEDWQKKIPYAKNSKGRLDLEQVRSAITTLLSSNNGIADPTRWFDDELRDFFGIDVFSHPYNIDQGFIEIEKENFKLLLIRMEDLNRSMVNALKAFLGINKNKKITMHRSNSGAKKWYADDLKLVKNSYSLPPHIAKNVLTTEYVRHFYPDMMDKLWKRWVKS